MCNAKSLVFQWRHQVEVGQVESSERRASGFSGTPCAGDLYAERHTLVMGFATGIFLVCQLRPEWVSQRRMRWPKWGGPWNLPGEPSG